MRASNCLLSISIPFFASQLGEHDVQHSAAGARDGALA
jgi:hypothetical protein